MRRLLAILIGGAAAMLGGTLAWLVVRPTQVWESGAFMGGPEVVIVVVIAVAIAAVATVLAWRKLVGEPLESMEWQLVFGPRAAPATTDGAHTSPPTVAELLAPLEALGYALDAGVTDDLGRRQRDARPTDRLGGVSLELRERTGPGRVGHVLARIPRERAEGEESLGFLDVRGAVDGLYEELGHYVIAALGRLYPELTYNRLGSGLTNEPANALWSQLPARPEKLRAN